MYDVPFRYEWMLAEYCVWVIDACVPGILSSENKSSGGRIGFSGFSILFYFVGVAACKL